MTAPIVIPRPDPLTVLTPAWCVLLGVVGAVMYHNAPPASTGSIPTFSVYIFFGGMILSGASLLYGMWLRSVRGLRIKRGANVALGSLLMVYSGWTMQALGIVRPFYLVSIFLTISVASFWQARRLSAALNPKG